jgi:hypothetical protein
LIPFSHAERNFAAANEPKSLLEIAGEHINVLDAGREAYLAGLIDSSACIFKGHWLGRAPAKNKRERRG